jgi:hypothetical protein
MQALDKLSNAIYLESQFYGPESIYLCSSYFYMGEVFKKEGQVQQAKNFYQKISTNTWQDKNISREAKIKRMPLLRVFI